MDTLKELFPSIRDHELRQYLNSSNNDLDLCVSMILSDRNNSTDTLEEQTPPLINQLEELKLMFPKLDPKVVESVFKDEKGIISNAITYLLNLEYINNETSRLSDITIISSGQNTIIPKERSRSRNNWKNTYNDIDILTDLLNWNIGDQSLLMQLYQENCFNPIKTLISIILKQIHPSELHSSARSSSPPTSKGKSFSRVQNNTGFAHNRSKKNGQSNSTASTKISSINSKLYQNANENLYISYDEYLSLIKEDKQCDGINPQFIVKLFRYFQNNESKTNIQYCHKILQYILYDPNGIALTFNKYDNERSWSSVPANNTKMNTPPTTSQSSSNTNKSIEMDSIYTDPKIGDVFETFKLDFHGFTPQQAIIVLNKIINKWWDEELRLRELNNYNMKQQRVTCLEPLTLITGRGIHSIGGKSPVRFQVKRYLQLNGYLFNENPSYFEVYGKQRKDPMKK